jgi:peptidoglycan hydrolase-like protein with peptidoglycan-binding domain
MKTLTPVLLGFVLVALTAMQGAAQTSASPSTVPARESGDRAEVERVQKALKQMGHDPGPIDGVMGERTREALRAYQAKQGLGATGRLDDATLAKLGQSSASPAASDKSPAGGDTRPNAVDPAQATKTGANAGEGASYSRSTEKGASTLSGADQKKSR